MRFVALNTWSSDENYDADCHVALVTIGSQEVEEMLERIALAAKQKGKHDIDAVVWYDRSPYFMSTVDADLPEEIMDALADKGLCVVNKAYEGLDVLSKMEKRMDIVRAFVDRDGVYWEGRPKHTSISVGTAEVTKEFLEKLQKGEA